MNKQNENSNTDQKKQKKQKIKRYAFAQRKGDDFTCIKLLDGEYEGIIYKYNNVKFEEVTNSGQIPLQFTYDVFVNSEKKNVDSQQFKNYIGDILVELVDQQLKDGTLFDKQQ